MQSTALSVRFISIHAVQYILVGSINYLAMNFCLSCQMVLFYMKERSAYVTKQPYDKQEDIQAK